MRGILRTGTAIATLLAFWLVPAFQGAAAEPRQTVSQTTEAPTGEVPRPPREGTPATVIDNQDITSVLGKSVRSSAGEDMGRIVDVLINRAGQVRAAVIDFGGFLGVGSRKIAVDWSTLHFAGAVKSDQGRPDQKSDQITLDLTRDQVRLTPEYKSGQPIVVLGPETALQPSPAESPASSEPPTAAGK
jgi:PRC-barrel domain protein